MITPPMPPTLQIPTMHFDLVDLKLFVHVGEEHSLTRGADRSNISLSAASMRIKNLESAFGTQLLLRNKSGTTLTPAGEALLQHARDVFGQIQRMRGELQEFAGGMHGHIRLFANITAVTEFLPTVLGQYLKIYPPMSIDLQERLSVEIVRAVHEGLADIGIIAGNIRTDGLETRPYRADRLVLVCAIDHPLVGRKAVWVKDVMEYDFVGLGTNSAIHAFIEQVMESNGQKMRQRIQVASFDTMCQMVEANVGIGVMPESAANRHARSTSIHIIQLLDEWAAREMKICVRRFDALPTFARRLVDYIVAYDDKKGMQEKAIKIQSREKR